VPSGTLSRTEIIDDEKVRVGEFQQFLQSAVAAGLIPADGVIGPEFVEDPESVLLNSTQHTINHLNCPACSEAEVEIHFDYIGLADMPFAQAIDLWIGAQKADNSKKPRTHESNLTYSRGLKKFFGQMPMRQIMPGHLKMYQQARAINAMAVEGKLLKPWHRPCTPGFINHEMSLLRQLLKSCKLWAAIQPWYFPLSIPSWSPREILSEQAEAELFRATAGDELASLAYYVTCVSNETTATGIELRGLKIKNISLKIAPEISSIYIPPEACKNDERPRRIPLKPTAIWAMSMLLKRAFENGASQPDHYLFAWYDKRTHTYDPIRPATRWFLRRSWNRLRALSGQKDLKPHDFRHHSITRMLEEGVDPEMIEQIAGHVGKRMRDYYSHARVRAKMEALNQVHNAYDPVALFRNARKRGKRPPAPSSGFGLEPPQKS
jgi:integrase